MEGGVRQSRASSRYSSSPSPAAFNGPVRKWKKQWVATPPPIPNNRNNNAANSILLRRWTPIPADDADDQPPTRRFRYAPVVPIVKGNKNAPEKVIATSTRNQTDNNGAHMTGDNDGILEKPSSGYMIPQEEEEEADEELSENSNKSDGHGYTSEKRRKTGQAEESEIEG